LPLQRLAFTVRPWLSASEKESQRLPSMVTAGPLRLIPFRNPPPEGGGGFCAALKLTPDLLGPSVTLCEVGVKV
jgi:hypothetical protein